MLEAVVPIWQSSVQDDPRGGGDSYCGVIAMISIVGVIFVCESPNRTCQEGMP